MSVLNYLFAGIIDGKTSRGLIHCAMRVEFPVLLSVTYKNRQVRLASFLLVGWVVTVGVFGKGGHWLTSHS